MKNYPKYWCSYSMLLLVIICSQGLVTDNFALLEQVHSLEQHILSQNMYNANHQYTLINSI